MIPLQDSPQKMYTIDQEQLLEAVETSKAQINSIQTLMSN